ncbi:FtsX-like permease family protein [candidate division WWE3 bacterium]|jgi:putative ABC transport system permease protein|uniref:FtsX-like permease family protein n=1 Tax=candidate division WWE3 bacterium TaxID=2053526 RepID=A0A3A4ZAY8_UNCKA|nr:MAG: FtsX-like permease family protein [candidate division WWE3 bacterium]
MNFLEIFRSSILSLRANKVRTFLTMLGVIIGVFAVLSLVSLVRGVQNFVTDQFSALGSNLILVAPGRVGFDQDPGLAFANNKLTAENVDRINRDASQYIIGATPNMRLGKTIQYKTKRYLASLVGTNSNFLSITDLEIDYGRAFTKEEEITDAKVLVLGPDVKNELFGNRNPIGEKVKVGDTYMEVIGVLTSKGFNADERVIAPYTTLQKVFNTKNISGITIKAKDSDSIDKAMTEIEIALLQDLKDDEFTVLSQKDILSSIQSILSILSVGIGSVAAISLIVGGIGIMNIMLVSVTERIREIGLRKALGATSMTIGIQFLLESIMISIVGGSIGIFLGFAAAFAAQSFVRAEVPLWAVLLSFLFSVLTGVIFGTYPAIQASKKEPIEALRYE